jgi:tetratricopeptide (TPR) repeat protein
MKKNTSTGPQKRSVRFIPFVLVLGFFLLSIFLCVRTFLIPQYMRESAHLFAHGEYDAARTIYKKILRLDARNAYAWDWSVYSYSNEGRFDEALAIGEEALRAIPNDISLRITLGDVHLRNGQYEKAREYFSFIRTNKERALKAEYLYAWPAYKTGMFKLAVVYEKTGAPDKARQILLELLDVYPHDPLLQEQVLRLAQ